MGTENGESCSQRDSAERKGYVRAHRSFNRIWKERDSAEPDILGKILDKDNLNRAYKRVKANKGAPGIDGMTIEAALLWLKEHNRELTERIQRGKYTPSPVRRVEIPKPDGGIRKLGIPTVIDRMIQQAMLQQLMPIYEPLFSDDSFGYRPGRGAKDAVFRIKEYIGQGYTRAVVLDLSKYFDTLNHTILLNLLRKQVKDERVIQMVKRYLKSGVMENGVVIETEEGSPQGGVISPVLANMFLHYVFDMWMKRNFPQAPFERYADDGVVHCRTKEEALYIKEKLAKRLEECKLELHPVKTRIVYCKDKDRTKEEELTEFDFLGYTFKAVYIKCKDGVMRNNFIASVSKTAAKGFRDKIKALEIHKRTGCKIDMIAELLNPMIRGWMNYFGKFNPSAMKNTLQCIERRLIKWAMCKYKSFRGRRRRAEKWLSSIRKREPKLFAHWSRMYSYC